MNFGEAVKKERERRGISRYRLSKMSGVSLTLLGYYERGERTPTIDKANQICRALEWEFVLGKFMG